MGIRVICPNGHKLNLKSFLAGKRGVCPKCGAKFDIPAQGADDKPTEDADAATPGQPQTSDATGGSGGSAPKVIAPGASPDPAQTPIVPSTALPPTSSPQSPASSIPGQSAGTTTQTSASPASAAAENLAPVQPVAAVSATPQLAPVQATSPAPTVDQGADLFAEAPEACWYVRPPTGGQYGPAKSDVMRQWIDEGRVTPDSLVWREGWSDWQSASMLFPSLSEGSVTSASMGTPDIHAATDVPTASKVGVGEGALPSVGPSSSSGRRATNYRRKDHTGRVMAIGFLCLSLIVLTVLLVYVLVYKP